MKEAIITEIVEKVFQKAKSECSKDSKHALSKHISEVTTLSSKTIERLYDKYLEKRENIGEHNEHTINELCKYLNYDSYLAYVKQNVKNKIGANIIRGRRNTHLKIIVAVSLIIGIGLIFGLGQVNKETQCMVWRIDHFEKIACKVNYKENIVPLDEVRLENLKKVEVDLTTEFFDETTGQPMIWYYKSGNTTEYYTAPGLHPINGKTLKAITPHIIEKYIHKHKYNSNSFLK